IAEELGVPLSTAVNALLKQFVRARDLSISASYKPSAYLREVIAESEKERKAGKVQGPFDSVEELMESLDV
ncbi:MAG: hypothetical protein U1A28_00315, partial [Patescibacteria group bacterium]|nr:hypothetical protein [Patescibacteria group bacterium]